MNRELCKFLAGAAAGVAYAHGVHAVAVSRGMMEESFLGRTWQPEYLWAEAAAFSVASLALGYFGWFRNLRRESER